MITNQPQYPYQPQLQNPNDMYLHNAPTSGAPRPPPPVANTVATAPAPVGNPQGPDLSGLSPRLLAFLNGGGRGRAMARQAAPVGTPSPDMTMGAQPLQGVKPMQPMVAPMPNMQGNLQPGPSGTAQQNMQFNQLGMVYPAPSYDTGDNRLPGRFGAFDPNRKTWGGG